MEIYVIFISIIIINAGCCNANIMEIEKHVFEINQTNFNVSNIPNNEAWLIAFYAPWCKICDSFFLKWDEVSLKLHDSGIIVAKADISENQVLRSLYEITRFPTIKYIRNGTTYSFFGKKDVETIIKFVIYSYMEDDCEFIVVNSPVERLSKPYKVAWKNYEKGNYYDAIILCIPPITIILILLSACFLKKSPLTIANVELKKKQE